MATAPSPNDLTRQQLDELDALLQRMLTLPLNAPDAPPPTPGAPVNWRVDPPAVSPAPPPHIAAPPLPTDLPNPFSAPIQPPPEPLAPLPFAEPVVENEVPIAASTVPAAVMPAPVPPMSAPEPATPILERPVPPSRPAPAPSPPLEVPPPPRPVVVRAPARPKPAFPAPKPAPEPVAVDPLGVYAQSQLPPEPVPFFLWPLVGFNWTVDTLLGLFGPPGRLLRSGFGKNMLALVGIALLVYTAGHVATEMGLVSLPFPIPWPR